MLSSASASGQKVAIRESKRGGMYISCRTKFSLTNSALAEYRRYIGEYEQFQIHHCVAKGTFSFRSHNDLYLDYNKQLGTIAFKPRTMEEATWLVHPLGLGSWDEQDSEHVVFAGVCDQAGTFLVAKVAEGIGPEEWKTDFDQIMACIFEDLPEESCSIFQHPITNHQWCVAKYDSETVAMVISTARFPPALTAECHDELTVIFKNTKDPKKVERMKKMGLVQERIVAKELAGLMLEYDEQYYMSIRNAKKSKVEKDIQELQQKMGENIQQLQNNMENVESLVSKADELLEMSKLFKKQTQKLPTHWRRATVLVGTGLGAGAGALAGWLIGGPGGALLLASEGLEIGAAAVAAGVLGGSIGASSTVSFWSRRFVKLVIPSKLSTN